MVVVVVRGGLELKVEVLKNRWNGRVTRIIVTTNYAGIKHFFLKG